MDYGKWARTNWLLGRISEQLSNIHGVMDTRNKESVERWEPGLKTLRKRCIKLGYIRYSLINKTQEGVSNV